MGLRMMRMAGFFWLRVPLMSGLMRSIACVLFILTLGQGAAQAATYYVATWGNNYNAGTSDRPFQTLRYSISRLRAGDTLIARGGNYYEALWINVTGAPDLPITIKAYTGERPVIDGQNWRAANWGNMVTLQGSYLIFDGFEVKNGLGQGISINGQHNVVTRCNVHHHAQRGVLVAGDYGTVENTRVWWNAWYNCRLSSCAPTKYPNGGWGTGLSAARGSGDGITSHAILRGNTVYHNWGEGLSTFESEDVLLEGNVVYNNWVINIYVSNAVNAVVKDNLVYYTPNNEMQRVGLNIGLADERSYPLSHDIEIANNLVKGGKTNLFWWIDNRVPYAKMKNVLIAHNTIVDTDNTDKYSASLNFLSAPHENVVVMNNLIKQDTVARCINRGSGGDFRFSSNLWSKAPSSSSLAWNDVVAAPRLLQWGSTASGQLTSSWFQLSSTSPAINKATPTWRVPDDYDGKMRDTTPDMGGHEF